MKKNLLLLTTLFFIVQLSNVNAQSYSFTHSTGTYADLPSPTVLSSPYWDDYSIYPVHLPFAFTYFGTAFDSVWVMSGFEGFTYDPNSGFGDYEIGSYEYAELTDNQTQTATISIQTTGSAPNRIFKIETKNAGFYNNSSGTDYVSYQLWFYETSNVIEIHFGPNSVLDPASWEIPGSTGPGIILAKTAAQFLALSGPAANPNATTTFVSYTVTGAPADGMIYIFTPTSTGIDEKLSRASFSVYPNPTNGKFQIEAKDLTFDGQFNIYDVTGKLVYQSTVSFVNRLSAEVELASGIYTSELNDGKEIIIRKKLVIE